MTGRYGHDPFDRMDCRPLKTDDTPETIPQRKATNKQISVTTYEPRGQISAKDFIKRLVLDDESLSARDIFKLVAKAGHEVTLVTVSCIRAEFKHTLHFLRERNKLRA
jgi:hypothetical protein